MTFETLSRGNSLIHKRMEIENHITILEDWIEELKKGKAVLISSTKDHNKFIIELDGLKFLPLVNKRLQEAKDRLEKINKEFDSL